MNPALILGAFVCAGLIHVSAFVGTSLSPLRKVDSKYLNQYVSNLYRVNGILQSGSNTCEFEQITVGVRQQLNAAVDAGKAPKEITEIVLGFIEEYSSSFQEAGETPENFGYQVSNMLKYTMEALSDPYQFSANHQAIREPFDFYKWGNDFLRPLIIRERSKLFGKENALQLMETIRNGGNAVILSNHQTEADPQVQF
jgi:hypothetical protein